MQVRDLMKDSYYAPAIFYSLVRNGFDLSVLIRLNIQNDANYFAFSQ